MRGQGSYLRCLLTAVLLPVAMLLPVVLGSCGRSATEKRLEAISELVDEYPDSALTLLADIDTTSLRPGRERALYDLDLTAARYFRGDALNLNTLEKYDDVLKNLPDGKHKTLWLLLRGIGLYSSGEYPSAVVFFLEAGEIAEKNSDFLNQGRAMREISDICITEFRGEQGIEYGEKALSCFKKSGREELVLWQMWNLSQSYFNLRKYDETLCLLNDLRPKAVASNDTGLLNNIIRLTAKSYLMKKEYQKALDEMSELNDENPEFDYYVLGYCLAKVGRLDKARDYALKIPEEEYGKGEILYMVAYGEGDYVSAGTELVTEYNKQTQHALDKLNDNFDGAIAKYHENKHLEELKVKHRREIIGIVLFAVIIVSIGYGLVFHKKKMAIQKLEIERNIFLKEFLKNELDELKKSSQQEKEVLINEKVRNEFEISSLNSTLRSQMEALGNLKKELEVQDHPINTLNRILVTLWQKEFKGKKQQKTEKSDQALQWEDMRSFLKDAFIAQFGEDMMTEFCKNVYGEENKHFWFFTCRALGLSTSSIAFLFKTNPDNVYTIAKRIKSAIEKNPSINTKRFVEMLSVKS